MKWHGIKSPANVTNIMEIMTKTCWSSLSYCCSLQKKCERRDIVMKELAMTNKEYEELKNMFDKEVIERRK